jgi:hypothetical protein
MLLGAGFLFSSFDNAHSHKQINTQIVNQFEKKFINSVNPLARFKNYTFVLQSNNIKLPGSYIDVGALHYKDVVESEKSLRPIDWIEHGGFSADEPEVFASFRHFYDPLENAGKRYLRDHLDDIESYTWIVNPKIDHVEWALSHAEHQYNWTNGKTAMISALQSPDKDFQNEEMAFAYRALGETLHLIADMGLPAHVRDDSHPSEGSTGWYLGSPDWFEVYMAEFAENDDKAIEDLFKKGKLDLSLMDAFRSAKTVEDIAVKLAKYTNENFFTGQTIYGSDVQPIIHQDDPYTAPSLNDCAYDEITYYYTKTISGNANVKMCRDLSYRLGIFEKRGYPYIDKECTKSQAAVLLPQIIEAGVNTMRLFIPELEVTITEVDEDERIIRGKVKHKVNAEYPREIKYNNNVFIFDAKTGAELLEIECVDGEFEYKIPLLKFNSIKWKKNGVKAGISFGGIHVFSGELTEEIYDPNHPCELVFWNKSEDDLTIEVYLPNGDLHYSESIPKDYYRKTSVMMTNENGKVINSGAKVVAYVDGAFFKEIEFEFLPWVVPIVTIFDFEYNGADFTGHKRGRDDEKL